ncbi:MAG: right-handed parallel beta-helix repeat-containing protein [Rhizobiaceae bacterium]|nr:right-handed parallel beta-helix repeat-containing protein [Rhizobiaceae bacterium]
MKHSILSAIFLASTVTFGSNIVHAETTECTEITSVPTTITVQGVYCLKGDLNTNITSGNAITINTNNVTIDLNGWKLGGLAAGAGTNARGISATNRKNIVIRNGSIRGFRYGIFILGTSSTSSSGHLVESVLADGNRLLGILIQGGNVKIINNSVINTGLSDIGSQAVGISVTNGLGAYVAGNTVSGLEETGNITGILITSGENIVVENNRILNLKNALEVFGIEITGSSAGVLLKGNVLSTNDNGNRAVEVESSTDVACVDNAARGFTATFTDCDTNSGNVAY